MADVFSIFAGVGQTADKKQKRAELAEVEKIHARYFASKTPGRRMRLMDRPNRYVTSEDTLQALIRKLQRRVGSVASGWKAGLQALGVTVPAWVRSKNRSGSAQIVASGYRFDASVTHADVPQKIHSELNRRILYGRDAQIRAMEREIDFLHRKQAEKFK